MKARRIKIIKEFPGVKVGDVYPVRPDIGEDLIKHGFGEWVMVDIKPTIGEADVQAPIVKEAKPEPVKEDFGQPVVEPPVEKKKRTRKPKAKENKELKPNYENK
jgi:hypothetical protein